MKNYIFFFSCLFSICLLLTGCSTVIKVSDSRIESVEYNGKWVTVNLADGVVPEDLYREELVPVNADRDMRIEEAEDIFGPVMNQYLESDGHVTVYEIPISTGIIRISEIDYYTGGPGSALDYLPSTLNINDMFDPVVSSLIDTSKEETVLQFVKDGGLVDLFFIQGSRIVEI